jgi:hypothetical protein
MKKGNKVIKSKIYAGAEGVEWEALSTDYYLKKLWKDGTGGSAVGEAHRRAPRRGQGGEAPQK